MPLLEILNSITTLINPPDVIRALIMGILLGCILAGLYIDRRLRTAEKRIQSLEKENDLRRERDLENKYKSGAGIHCPICGGGVIKRGERMSGIKPGDPMLDGGFARIEKQLILHCEKCDHTFEPNGI